MDTLNQKFNIEITVLSPLSIGAGAEKDWARVVDYLIKDDKIYFLNLKKMIQSGIDANKLSSFFATKNEAGMLSLIGNKLENVSDRIVELPTKSDNDIKSFIKNELSGNPIIPGSSLKGAVRSVILDYLIGNQKPQQLKEKDYFGDSNKGDELMRFIKFSDAEFEKTALVNTKIFNLRKTDIDWLGGWKFSGNKTDQNYQATGFNTLYEAILPNQKSVSSVMFSDIDLFKREIARYRNNKNSLLGLQQLFAIINSHTKDYIDKEIAFFNKYSTDKTDVIVSSLQQIKEQISTDNSYCILKMSAGSGFHSITGDWQYDNYVNTGIWLGGKKDGKKKYKSRKIAIHDGVFSLMGFVKLRSISDEEFQAYQAEIEMTKQKIEAEKQLEKERIRLEQEKVKQEQESKAKEDAERQEQLEKEQLEKEAGRKS